MKRVHLFSAGLVGTADGINGTRQSLAPAGDEEVPGHWYYESLNSRYNISLTWVATATQVENLNKNYLANLSPLYQVGYNNCTTAAAHAINYTLNLTGNNKLPETSFYTFKTGPIDMNPADLGEDLRSNVNERQGGSFYSVQNNSKEAPPIGCN